MTQFWPQSSSTSLTPEEFAFVKRACARYLPDNLEGPFDSFVVPTADSSAASGLVYISLPIWGQDLGVGEQFRLLVPASCIVPGDAPDWQRCDWWRALFTFLSGEAEREFEAAHRPIHSYSGRLPEALQVLFDYAWCNRIVLFIRRLAAHGAGASEEALFGPKPVPRVHLTHDVDALSKTLPIRLKKMAFETFNAGRRACQGKLGEACKRLGSGISFGVRSANYWQIETVTKLEESYALSSTFNLYGGGAGWGRSPRRTLMDPGYDVRDPQIATAFRGLLDRGFQIGLHQSYDAWQSSAPMAREKQNVEGALGQAITGCRQHWLRFSWEHTWRAQEEAGFQTDMTLGFNDRPGFRTGAALRVPAWTMGRGSPTLDSVPMVLMDSHLFDYGMFDADQRRTQMDRWLDEIRFVGGEASVIWHQRVFHSEDYGWGDDYDYLLRRVASL